VIIGCNPRRYPEGVRTVDTGSCSQNPQNVPPGGALTELSPLSLPQMSGKTSEKGKKKKKAQTFENDSILGAPKVAEKPRHLVSLDMYKFRLISQNIELVGMPKILGRVDMDTVIICLRRCREFCIKMWVILESQTFLHILETEEVPKNLLNARTYTERL
jgi:hypothetical protein